MHRRTRRLATTAATLAIGLAACGSEAPTAPADPGAAGPPVAPSSATPDPDDATTGSPTAPSDQPFTANTDPDEGEADGMPSTVVDLQLESRDGFDRLTITMSGEGRPGWLAQYEDEPTRQGSGSSVQLSGDATLVLRLSNTAYPGDTSRPEGYEGERTLYGEGVIEQVEYAGVYEGYTEVFIGTFEAQPFRVFWDDATSSVIVEVVSA